MSPLDKADADTARNASVADMRAMLRLELRAELLFAMANGQGVLREYRDDGKPHEIGRDLPSMLRDLLDDVEDDETESALMRALVNVLQHSECPEVGAWRLLAAEQYAERADDIAEMSE